MLDSPAAAARADAASPPAAAAAAESLSVNQTSTTTIKRDEMIARLQQSEHERLQHLEAQRQQRLQSAAFDSSSTAGLQQQVDAVLSSFSASAAELRSRIAALSSLTDSAALVGIEEGIAALRASLNRSSHLLPAHAVTGCIAALTALEQALDARKQELQPKKKFGFKSRQAVVGAVAAPAVSASTSASTAAAEPAASSSSSSSSSSSPSPLSAGFHSLSHRDLMLTAASLHRDIHLSDLSHCTVTLLGLTSSLHLSRLSHCRVLAGPTSGSALILDCSDCELVLAAHQLRLHSSQRCRLSLFCLSHPVIEHCSGIVVDPHYALRYDGSERDGQEAGMAPSRRNAAADTVLDFRWLRQQQSPNWRYAADSERLPDVSVQPADVRDDSGEGAGFTV